MSETAQGPYRRGYQAAVRAVRDEADALVRAAQALHDAVDRNHRGVHPEPRTGCGVCRALITWRAESGTSPATGGAESAGDGP